MKLALFFFLSVAVHAAAFLIPISFNGRAPDRAAIAVMILPLESVTELNGGAGRGQVAAGKRIAAKRPRKVSSSNQAGAAAPHTVAPAAEKIPIDPSSLGTDKIVVSLPGASMFGTASGRGEVATASEGAGGNNFAAKSLTPGSGNGSANDAGSGTGKAVVVLTQPRYQETPQPHYPDSARREGQEGRVLLRVLVDEEGRAKAVEVNTSSGHDTLDQAATEALKKWRFVPARAGGKPVKTWVNVPIEFQLSSVNP